MGKHTLKGAIASKERWYREREGFETGRFFAGNAYISSPISCIMETPTPGSPTSVRFVKRFLLSFVLYLLLRIVGDLLLGDFRGDLRYFGVALAESVVFIALLSWVLRMISSSASGKRNASGQEVSSKRNSLTTIDKHDLPV